MNFWKIQQKTLLLFFSNEIIAINFLSESRNAIEVHLFSDEYPALVQPSSKKPSLILRATNGISLVDTFISSFTTCIMACLLSPWMILTVSRAGHLLSVLHQLLDDHTKRTSLYVPCEAVRIALTETQREEAHLRSLQKCRQSEISHVSQDDRFAAMQIDFAFEGGNVAAAVCRVGQISSQTIAFSNESPSNCYT